MSYEQFREIYRGLLKRLLKAPQLPIPLASCEHVKIATEIGELVETFPEFTERADAEILSDPTC